MKKLQADQLKCIMFNYDIPGIQLAYHLNYSKQHISALRSGRFPISHEFQALLCNFLMEYRSVSFEEAAEVTKLK